MGEKPCIVWSMEYEEEVKGGNKLALACLRRACTACVNAAPYDLDAQCLQLYDFINSIILVLLRGYTRLPSSHI